MLQRDKTKQHETTQTNFWATNRSKKSKFLSLFKFSARYNVVQQTLVPRRWANTSRKGSRSPPVRHSVISQCDITVWDSVTACAFPHLPSLPSNQIVWAFNIFQPTIRLLDVAESSVTAGESSSCRLLWWFVMSMCCRCVIAVIVVLVFVGSYHIASYRHPCWRLQRCSPGLAGPERKQWRVSCAEPGACHDSLCNEAQTCGSKRKWMWCLVFAFVALYIAFVAFACSPKLA